MALTIILPGKEVVKKMRRLNNKGFTLVEIMIVVAIIVLLAAIAIPNLLRARLNANESAAIGALRTLSTALESYRAAQTPPQYPATLGVLSSEDPKYIDETLANAVDAAHARQGYFYTYTQMSDNEYSLTATPAQSGVTGNRIFFVDHTGVVRLNNAKGTPIQ